MDTWPRLRTAARLAALAGVVGTIGFLLHAGQRTPRFLLLIMAAWVLSPYAILALLDRFVARASSARVALYGVTMLVAATSLVVYGADAVRPLAARSAVPYVLVPPVSWTVIAIVVTVAALRSAGRILKTLALLIVVGIIVLIASIWIERRTELTLPAPNRRICRRARDRGLGRRCGGRHAGARARHQARGPRLDLVPGGSNRLGVNERLRSG